MTTRLFFILFIFPNYLFTQSPAPTFETFKGIVYKIPREELHSRYGYSNKVLSYEMVDSVEWEQLYFPDNDIDSIPFPEVSLRKEFAILFTSTMHISKPGTYGFALNSDDGSILWIGDKKVIDNDQPHKIRAKTGKYFLKEGSYPIKIWYFQAYLTRYGLEFSSRFLSSAKETRAIGTPQTIVLNNEALYFPSNRYKIDTKGIARLKKLASQLPDSGLQKITIIGHTDAIGTATDNLLLSTNRAIAVSKELKSLLTQTNIQFSVMGKGEQQPITSNETEEGRQQNRRVEIIIE